VSGFAAAVTFREWNPASSRGVRLAGGERKHFEYAEKQIGDRATGKRHGGVSARGALSGSALRQSFAFLKSLPIKDRRPKARITTCELQKTSAIRPCFRYDPAFIRFRHRKLVLAPARSPPHGVDFPTSYAGLPRTIRGWVEVNGEGPGGADMLARDPAAAEESIRELAHDVRPALASARSAFSSTALWKRAARHPLRQGHNVRPPRSDASWVIDSRAVGLRQRQNRSRYRPLSPGHIAVPRASMSRV